MAEFLGQKKPKKMSSPPDEGFGAMGKPIPVKRKLMADEHLKAMGIVDAEDRFTCIQMMSNKLEHDDPYGAMEDGMKYVDLTGTYRMLAVLLTGPK